jgi:hypothetical protein
MENQVLFMETQRFSTWVYVLVVAVTLLIVGVCAYMLMSRLETQIKDDGVYVRFYPNHRAYKKYTWAQLKAVYVRNYSPLSEYGGWGLKGFKGDRAYNMRGKTGLQLVMNDGSKLLIGTQCGAELEAILRRTGHYLEKR